jgi:hypothetical protein
MWQLPLLESPKSFEDNRHRPERWMAPQDCDPLASRSERTSERSRKPLEKPIANRSNRLEKDGSMIPGESEPCAN